MVIYNTHFLEIGQTLINLYKKHPNFIDNDPRKYRTLPYRTTPEFMQLRHELIFKNISFQNKTVLDLGCCVGYTGAWALEHGASTYCGVEFSSELCEIANDNFDKSFNNDLWELHNLSIEEFLESNTQKFDIVISMGVIYAFVDPIYFLKKIASIGNIIVIESSHPGDKNLNVNVLEKSAFVSYDWQRMSYNNTHADIQYYGSRPSISFVEKILSFIGFSISTEENNLLMQQLSDFYKVEYHKRFAIIARKVDTNKEPLGYVAATRNDEINTYHW